ncbi:hypothetical protein C8N46_11345 [Kordia periserrulae]|uniref:Uncharacterized protein n=1 Tax=Kordia periserrulae TaxID=701523 RepID=A0A2T6BR91_9FLAO|nr:hypothetical protein [Kordia periserrulae]PTX58554.1 hypothetical protein C8N46_11345 [Kordia periserrulae]
MPYNENNIKANVTLSHGVTKEIIIYRNQAFIDEKGYIRFFSLHYDDTILNMKLLPRNSTKSDIIKFCSDFLVPLGISFAFNNITKNGNIIVNLASYLFEEYAVNTIQDILEDLDMADYVYFAIDNGELVITHNLILNK